MMRTRSLAAVTLALCGLAVIGIVMSHLALTDIYHASEPDLRLEWWVVRATYVGMALLVVATGRLAQQILREP